MRERRVEGGGQADLEGVALFDASLREAHAGHVVGARPERDAETPSERFKLTVFIIDRALRADAVRVAVFRQVRDGAGNWVDAAVDGTTGTAMEDAILTRARQLRVGGSGVTQ